MKAEIRYSHKAEEKNRGFSLSCPVTLVWDSFILYISLGASSISVWGCIICFSFTSDTPSPKDSKALFKAKCTEWFLSWFLCTVFATESISIILQSLRDNISLLYDYVL